MHKTKKCNAELLENACKAYTDNMKSTVIPVDDMKDSSLFMALGECLTEKHSNESDEIDKLADTFSILTIGFNIGILFAELQEEE